MQARKQAAHGARLLDQGAQVRARAHFAVRELKRRALEPGLDQIVLERPLVLEILLRLAALHLEEGRLRNEEMPVLDHRPHLAEEEGEQQRADMRSVHVRVGHDDDLVVAQLLDVEVVAPDAGAERGDERADLLASQHLVEARTLDVEDLAAQRQHRLIFAVAALLGGAAGRIALDDEDLGLGRVALLAVGELAGQVGDVERALAPRQFAGLARRLARLRRLDHLADDDAGLLRMLLEPLREQFVDQPLDHRPHLGGDELVLRLRREFRVGAFDAEHAGEALAGVVAG